MRPRMRNLIPALFLALGACFSTPAEDRPIAGAVNGQNTPTNQAGKLKDMNVGSDQTGTVAETASAGPKPPAIDPTRRFEYAEVTVDIGDPVGMRALVPYLINPGSWTLIKCEMVSSTSKYYKFQKVT